MPSSRATRAPSSVADITSRRRSGRSAPCASSASARPRSASSERSWNSSNSTALMPLNSGSSRIMRAKTPSVTTSMRVRAETFDSSRTRRPMTPPTLSSSVAAMRAAAARAARRRGSSTMILPAPTHGSSSRASGTRVVLPAPGGATSTALGAARRAAASASRTSSIGSGAEKARMRPRCHGAGAGARRRSCRRPRPVTAMPTLCLCERLDCLTSLARTSGRNTRRSALPPSYFAIRSSSLAAQVGMPAGRKVQSKR